MTPTMKNTKDIVWIIEKYCLLGNFRYYINPCGWSIRNRKKKIIHHVPQLFESRDLARKTLRNINNDKYFPHEMYKISKFVRAK